MRQRTMRRVIHVLVVGVFVVFWWAFYAIRELREHRTRLFEQTRRPVVINGLTLDLRQHVEPSLRKAGSRGRYLLLFSSDRCFRSREVVTAWRNLLAAVPFTDHDLVILLTLSGDAIPGTLLYDLESRGTSYQIIHVRDPTAFAEATSLNFTPALVALDAALRVRLVASTFSSTVAEEVVRFFARPI